MKHIRINTGAWLATLALLALPGTTLTLWGQSSINLTRNAPPPVSSAGAVSVNPPSGYTLQNLYYWVVARYPAGRSVPTGPAVVTNATPVDLLSATRYVTVSWNPVVGATGYDVVRNTNPTYVEPCTACAVVLNTTSSTVNDVGGVLANYPPAGVPTVSSTVANITVNNQDAPFNFLQASVTGSSAVALGLLGGTFTANNCIKLNTDGTLGDSGMACGGGIINFGVIKPLVDGTTATQIANAAGSAVILNVDTTNRRVGINNTAPTADLETTGRQPAAVGVGHGTNASPTTVLTGGVGGDTSAAGAGTHGGVGGPITFTGGVGGVHSGAAAGALGGTGGGITVTSGQGGNTTAVGGVGVGGAGGILKLYAGNGGSSSNGLGGAGGSVDLKAGGGNTGTGLFGAGGGGGPVTVTSGSAAASSATATTSGNGGNILVTPGNGGDNSNAGGTAGNGGSVTIDGGQPGTPSGGAAVGAAGTVSLGPVIASRVNVGRNGAPVYMQGVEFNVTAPGVGNVLTYNGTKYVPAAPVAASPSIANTYTNIAATACAAGNSGQIALITSGYYNYARCDGANWSYFMDGIAMVPVNDAAYAWVNQAGATVVNTKGAAVLTTTNPGGVVTVQGRFANVPGATYTIETVINILPNMPNGYQSCGLFLYDGTKLEAIRFESHSLNPWLSLFITQFTDVNTPFGGPVASSQAMPTAQRYWFKIVEDGTNRTYSYSYDGAYYVQFYQSLTNAFLTPTKYGYAGNNINTTGYCTFISMRAF